MRENQGMVEQFFGGRGGPQELRGRIEFNGPIPDGVPVAEDGSFDLLRCLTAEAGIDWSDCDFTNVGEIRVKGYVARTKRLEDELQLVLSERGFDLWTPNGTLKAMRKGAVAGSV